VVPYPNPHRNPSISGGICFTRSILQQATKGKRYGGKTPIGIRPRLNNVVGDGSIEGRMDSEHQVRMEVKIHNSEAISG